MKKIIYSLIISALSLTSYAQSVIIQPNASGNLGVKTGANAIVNNIQIGPTTTPAFIGNDIAIGNSSGGGMSFFQSGAASSGTSIWYSNASHALMPAYGGTGNVGINWVNPVSRLEVYQTGKPSTGFGSYISPMRIGIGVTGSHATVGDNYDAIGVAGFGANANSNKRNIGVLGTSDYSGFQNIGVMSYQSASSNGQLIGAYNDVSQAGAGEAYASINNVYNSNTGSNWGVFSNIYNANASGNVSNFGVNSSVTSVNTNVNASNYGYYTNVTGSGRNYGLFASVSGGTENYALAAYGNTFVDGNVAIGASSIPALPKAKLVVIGNNIATNNSYTWFQSGSTSLTNLGLAGTFNSIYATHNIVTGAYIGAAVSVTASDNRIKKDFTLSNNSEDLARLRKIEITNYRMKDVDTWGNKTFKKVIAQQVETIYPEVIKRQTSVIPDIYALAEKVFYDATNKNLTISLCGTPPAKNYNIKIGEKIELVHPEKGKILSEIVAVSGNTFTVKDWQYPTDKIFVFGREVNDFRSVDYEALSMLGISAIQALAKENEEIRKENAKQKEDFNKRLDTIEVTLKSMNQIK